MGARFSKGRREPPGGSLTEHFRRSVSVRGTSRSSNSGPGRRSISDAEAELLQAHREIDFGSEATVTRAADLTVRGGIPNPGDKRIFATTRKKTEKLFAVAIDFGTSYSGLALSTLMRGQYLGLPTFEQEPTVVLMDPDKKFHSFGKKAKKHYAEQVKNKTEKDWYYFEHFKMKLFNQSASLDKDIELTDATGKSMSALHIIAASIKYMIENVLDTMRFVGDFTVDNIHFILTVPAIWQDLSKSFMRQAAVQAGIPADSLTLALEPEAASLYCLDNISDNLSIPGTGYIVADLGGGTADFTCHVVNANRTLREIHMPVGGDFGGLAVDHAFRDLLNKIFGAEIIHQFKTKYFELYLELFDTFETKKRAFDGSQGLVFFCPLELRLMFEESVGQSPLETIKEAAFNGEVELKHDKLSISISRAKQLFDGAISKAVDSINNLINDLSSVKYLVFVGGFSNSLYLQKVINEHFNQKELANKKIKVIFIQDAHLAVVKGAVLYGMQPNAIESRKCKYTYGIARMMRFKQHHSSRKRIVINGVEWCDDLFNKHIEAGATVRVGEDYPAKEYFPLTANMTQGLLEVYASTEKNPKYVDDPGCQLVGIVKTQLTGGDVNAKVLVRLIFGGTELRIEAVEEKTGNVTVGYIDFLG